MGPINVDYVSCSSPLCSVGLLVRDRQQSLRTKSFVQHMSVERRDTVHPLYFTESLEERGVIVDLWEILRGSIGVER